MISQIRSIDTILTTSNTIASALYSITIHSNTGTRRWRAGNSTISLYVKNIADNEEFKEILTHELGHIVDLALLKGNGWALEQNFYNIDKSLFYKNDPSISFYQISRSNNITRKASARAVSFVWGYAMSDPFEDFAEAFNMYLNHHHAFVLMSETDAGLWEKYQFMQKLFNNRYLQADFPAALAIKNKLQTRARDTTKGY